MGGCGRAGGRVGRAVGGGGGGWGVEVVVSRGGRERGLGFRV